MLVPVWKLGAAAHVGKHSSSQEPRALVFSGCSSSAQCWEARRSLVIKKRPCGHVPLLYPTETLLLSCLKHLAWSPAFSSVTWWCHHVTSLHKSCLAASLAHPQTKLVRVEPEQSPKSLVRLTNHNNGPADQSEQTGLFGRSGAGAQTERFKQRVKRGAASQPVWEK